MKDKLTFTIESAAVCGDFCAMESDNSHPNATPFEGTLLVVDSPSDRPPNGSEGHKILVPKDVAKKNLNTLIGMGLNYEPNRLSGHQPRHKVGVITKAWIDGNAVKVKGHIFAKDFPEAKRELKGKNIGMSMELANVLVKNKHDPIWKLIDFSFTGATALLKSAAAYSRTSLAATAERELQKLLIGENSTMATKEKKHRNKHVLSGNGKVLGNLVEALSSSIDRSLTKGFKTFGDKLEIIASTVKDQGEAITAMAAASAESNESSIAASKDSSDESMQASAEASDGDELAAAMESSDGAVKASKGMKAKKKDDDDDREDSSSEVSSEDDDDDLDAELEKLKKGPQGGVKAGPDEESSDPELGKLNKNTKNKGRKTEVNASGIHRVIQLAAAANKKVKKMKAHANKLTQDIRAERKERKKLESTVEEMQAQIEEFTVNELGPRAIPSDLRMLLSKGGANIEEIQASGRKFTVQEIDEIFAASNITLNPMEKMSYKNVLLERGYMEQGEINRRQPN